MKKITPKNRLSIKDVSVAKHMNLQADSLLHIKGGVVITEDFYGF